MNGPSRRVAATRAGLTLGLVLVADQLTKRFVDNAIARGEREDVFFGIDLVNVRNDGVAFGLFSDGGVVVAVITSVAVLGLLAFFLVHAQRRLLWLPAGLLAGGAAGNLVDRAREGAVVDFVDIGPWPPFNLADVSITVGVLALLLVLEGGRDDPAND